MHNASGFQLSNESADLYEDVLVPLWFGRWAQALLDRVPPAPGSSVLDVACGTGITTRQARRAVGEDGQVTGLDVNGAMLARARTLAEKPAPEEDRPGAITWLERSVCDTGLPDDHVDLVISQHGYHYFPDPPGALRELHRVLSPGGRIALSTWDGHSVYTAALCDAIADHLSADAARVQRSQRETPSQDALARALSRAGFHDVHVERQTLEIRVPPVRGFVPLHLRAMPIAAAFLDMPGAHREALLRQVETALEAHLRDGELVYSDSVNLAMGRK